MTKKMKSPASALGEAVGKLVEEGIKRVVEKIAEEYGCNLSKRKSIKDKFGIEYEIDLPIEREGSLVTLVDVKYLRYKKHARDKGSWVVVAHNKIRSTYPTIERSIVILLGGGWSEPAKRMIATSCINVIDITPSILNDILRKYGVEFVWEEKNDITPRKSWENFLKLNELDHEEIIKEIVTLSGIEEKVRDALSHLGNPRKKGNPGEPLDVFCGNPSP